MFANHDMFSMPVPTLKELYGERDNLSCFVHPVYRERFRLLNVEDTYRLAQTIARKIASSDYRYVFVSETGARPFADMCERILARSGSTVRWRSVKFPRESPNDVYPVIAAYLTPREKRAPVSPQLFSLVRAASREHVALAAALEKSGRWTRGKLLKEICAHLPQDLFEYPKQSLAEILPLVRQPREGWTFRVLPLVLSSTAFARRVAAGFLYFDEYVHSGTTLRNAATYFNFFHARPRFQIVSYCVKTRDAASFDAVFSTLYDATTELSAYRAGAYPFENRLDLIGHFYLATSRGDYEKITLSALQKSLAGRVEQQVSLDAISQLDNACRTHNILSAVKRSCAVEAVRTFLNDEHVLRFALAILEREISGASSPYAEMMWLLYDQYGPMWSPLPVEYHLDFWRGFEGIAEAIMAMPEFAELKKIYRRERAGILSAVLRICRARRAAYLAEVSRVEQDTHI